MKKNILKILTLSSICLAIQSSNAGLFGGLFGGSPACVFIDPQFTIYSKTTFSSANAKILADLKGMDLAVKKASQAETEAIAAAVFVLSNQKAVATEQINKALKDNTQIQANAIQAVGQAKRYQQVIKDYGKQGIGYDVCNVHLKRHQIQEATESVQKAVDGMVRTEITARAGRYADRNKAMATRLALHNKYYCTEGQSKAGLCTSGPRAGKSLSASTMFEPADYLSAEYNDKSALINNMVGLPDDPVPYNQASTLAGQAYTDLKRRKDAIKSTAMVSLKSIQASWSSLPSHDHEHEELGHKETTASDVAVRTENDALNKDAPNSEEAVDNVEKTDEPEHQSLMVQVKGDVDRYLGGGKEYENWSKALTGQEEKGVLTEILKIKALRLYMQTQQYRQLQRMEAMLAANVAAQTENSGMAGRVEQQRQRAVRNTIQNNLFNYEK